MTVNEALNSALAAEMKITITDNLNKKYTDQTVSSFLLKASVIK